MNLPTRITFTNNRSIEYQYDAAGVKLRKVVTDGNGETFTYYMSGFQYQKTPQTEIVELQFFPTSEGYVKALYEEGESYEPMAYAYVYNYTDHLGNIRLSYALDDKTGEVKTLEENHYYPFGLKHKNYNTSEYDIVLNELQDSGASQEEIEKIMIDKFGAYNAGTGYNYKYNGKELQDELGLQWYDYGMRMYNPATARWNAVDPLAEKYYDFSGYNYVKNSPVYLNDILGADIYDVNGVKADISYDKKGGITINNVSDLDTETVSLIISTYLETKVGAKTIKKLDKKGVKNQLVISNKVGIGKSGNKFGRIVGLTEKENIDGYDSRITIFRTDGDVNIDNLSSDDIELFDFDNNTHYSEKEKSKLLDVIKNNFVGKDAHEETKNAFEKIFTKKELDILRKIKNEMIKDPKGFGRITTVIHEGSHAAENATEIQAYRKEIKSFKKSNR